MPNDDEYSEPIERFINQPVPQGPQGPQGQQGQQVPPGNPMQQQVPPGNPMQQQVPPVQLTMSQKEAFQQAQMEQMMQHQLMQQQQQLMQPMMQQSHQNQSKESFTTTLMNKFKSINVNNSLKDILIIAVLFIIFSNSLFKNILGNYIPFINVSEFGDLNTVGLLFVSIVFAILYLLIKLFI